MADDKLKIQPANEADGAVGQSPATGATGELPDLTAEQFAGLSDQEKLAYVGNAKQFIKTATQKSQEAAEIRKANEQLQAEREYFKSENQKQKELIDKYNEYLLQSQQRPEVSTPSQPPTYDPYNPDKSIDALRSHYDGQLKQRDSTIEELKGDFESLKEETNVGLRTIKMERYLEKAIPQMGPDVSQEEVVLWFNMHPDVEPTADSISQAIRERQSLYDTKVQAKYEDYLKQKEEAAKGAQESPGAPFAGGAPDLGKFTNMTSAEQEAEIAKFFGRK